jgi:hypothetical protein
MLTRQPLEELVPAAVAAIVLAFWLFWIGDSGGFGQTVWYPSTLGMLALWILVLAWRRQILPEYRVARFALLAFAALVAFSYLSIAWAGSPGSALDASNQLTLYLLGAWILAILPWTPARLAAFAGLWSLGVAVFCAESLVRAVSASTLTSFFVVGRFATPMQYSNATAALAVMGMWPVLVLSSRRELPAVLRAACLGVGTFLATFALLPQSRAALLGMILTAVLVAVVGSSRGRLVVRLLIVGGAVAYSLPKLIHVNRAVDAGRNVTPALRHAATGMLLAAVAATVIGLIAALVEDRLEPRARAWPPGPRRAWRRAARPLAISSAVLAAIVVAVALVITWPHIHHFVRETIHKGNTDAQAGTNRFLSASPEERFDYDRVALRLWSESPIGGIGSGNFGRRYDAMRRFPKHSQFTHDLPLRVLSETGVVGMILFIALVGALVVGMSAVARSRRDLGRGCVTFAFAVAGYFLVHSCLDWVDEFPALAVPAVGLPFAALALRQQLAGTSVDGTLVGDTPVADTPVEDTSVAGDLDSAAEPAPSGRGRRRYAGPALVAIAAAAIFVAVASSYLSLVSINRAFSVYRANPNQAYSDLRVARALSPLSASPLTSEGTIALYAGDLARSQQAFLASLGKEDDWYPRLELALIAAHEGRFGAARRQLTAAAALDADDPLIAEARQLIDHHHRINPIRFNRQIEQLGSALATPKETIR